MSCLWFARADELKRDTNGFTWNMRKRQRWTIDIFECTVCLNRWIKINWSSTHIDWYLHISLRYIQFWRVFSNVLFSSTYALLFGSFLIINSFKSRYAGNILVYFRSDSKESNILLITIFNHVTLFIWNKKWISDRNTN